MKNTDMLLQLGDQKFHKALKLTKSAEIVI